MIIKPDWCLYRMNDVTLTYVFSKDADGLSDFISADESNAGKSIDGPQILTQGKLGI